MLTRLKVSGFKNLVDVDVRLGPFTCIAGENGTGKSNLFDAIRFMSALADMPLIEAALSVRDEGGRTADIRSLFHHIGDDYVDEMVFEAEMIIPETGVDDLGQEVEAAATLLRYRLALRYQLDHNALPGLKIVFEELISITEEVERQLLFPHSFEWAASTVKTAPYGIPMISTRRDDSGTVIRLYGAGVPDQSWDYPAENLSRTVLSAGDKQGVSTVFLARQEMRSWRILHLNPAAIRQPDDMASLVLSNTLKSDGSHLAATLYYLAEINPPDYGSRHADRFHFYAELANRLSELLEGVRDVTIDRDDQRGLLTLQVTNLNGARLPARALSDGTLRFLALATLYLDPRAQGVFCLEEPENGIHPSRIPALLRLLSDIAVDVYELIGEDNPLRQVIITTHSPSVVLQVSEDSLVITDTSVLQRDGKRSSLVQFGGLPNTWRAAAGGHTTALDKLLSFLYPAVWKPQNDADYVDYGETRVLDRLDLQPFLPGFGE